MPNQNQKPENVEFITRCCERDYDCDGNCDIHSAPGVLRNTNQAVGAEQPSTLCVNVRDTVAITEKLS